MLFVRREEAGVIEGKREVGDRVLQETIGSLAQDLRRQVDLAVWSARKHSRKLNRRAALELDWSGSAFRQIQHAWLLACELDGLKCPQ